MGMDRCYEMTFMVYTDISVFTLFLFCFFVCVFVCLSYSINMVVMMMMALLPF